jgi:hypothetical protein
MTEMELRGIVKRVEGFWCGGVITDAMGLFDNGNFSITFPCGKLTKHGFVKGDLVKVRIELIENITGRPREDERRNRGCR